MYTIFVVEDNESILEGICSYLELSGFSVRPMENIHQAEVAVKNEQPDLMILDVMLPDGDGFSFARRLRKSQVFPIVFLTARDSESDRILGFELGADDYVVKPFSPKELVMRIHAILRRHGDDGTHGNSLFRQEQAGIDLTPEPIGNSLSVWRADQQVMEIDTRRHVVRVNSHDVKLTAAEWRILTYLAVNCNMVISRDQILENCLDYSFDISDRIVDTHIKNIRAKLTGRSDELPYVSSDAEAAAPGARIGWIRTVRGYGYVFSAEQVDPAAGQDFRTDGKHAGTTSDQG